VGEAKDATQDEAQDRVTIQEAARRLGVKEDAIRKRIQRGSMRHEKAEDGRVFVWVGVSRDATQDTRHESKDATHDKTQDERLEDLREQVGYLRRQLDEERDARRRADTIIAQLARANEEQARTIRELEVPQEASEASETVEEAPDRAEPWPATGEAQDELGAERARRETAESTLHEGMAEEHRRREAAERERDDLRRELFARREPRGSPQTVEEEPERVAAPRPTTSGPQESTWRRWRRRWFGN
jgi:excisionase family DNA binding protein